MTTLTLTRPNTVQTRTNQTRSVASGKMVAAPARPSQRPSQTQPTPTVSRLLASIKPKPGKAEVDSNSTDTQLATIEDLEYTRVGSKEWVRCPGCSKEIKFDTVKDRVGFLCGKCLKDSKFSSLIANAPVACPKCQDQVPKTQLDTFHNESCEKCFIDENCVNLPVPSQISCIAGEAKACKGETITLNEFREFCGVCKPCTMERMKVCSKQFEEGELSFEHLLELQGQREQKRNELIASIVGGDEMGEGGEEGGEDGGDGGEDGGDE